MSQATFTIKGQVMVAEAPHLPDFVGLSRLLVFLLGTALRGALCLFSESPSRGRQCNTHLSLLYSNSHMFPLFLEVRRSCLLTGAERMAPTAPHLVPWAGKHPCWSWTLDNAPDLKRDAPDLSWILPPVSGFISLRMGEVRGRDRIGPLPFVLSSSFSLLNLPSSLFITLTPVSHR